MTLKFRYLHWKANFLSIWRERLIFGDKHVPYYSGLLKCWGVAVPGGVEYGPLDWVLSEWLVSGPTYRYQVPSNQHDSSNSFEDAVRILMAHPDTFSIKGFEVDYSHQQLALLDQVQKQYMPTPDSKRWKGFVLPEVLDGVIIEDEFIGKITLRRDYDQLFRNMQSPFHYYQHDHIILIPDAIPSDSEWNRKLKVFGEKLVIPGDFVLCFHVDDQKADEKVLSALKESEITALRQNVYLGKKLIQEHYHDFHRSAEGTTRYGIDYPEMLGLIYRYHTNWIEDNPHAEHATTFDQVLTVLVHDPKHFSIVGYEEDYNAGERAFIDAIKNWYLVPRAKDRWQGFSLPLTVPGALLDLQLDSLQHTAANRDYYVGIRHIKAPFNYYRHGDLLIIADPVPHAIREQHKQVVAFGQAIPVEGTFVLFLHVNDWLAKPKVVGLMSDEEFNLIKANVSINGVSNLLPPPSYLRFYDEKQRQNSNGEDNSQDE
jgi:hypothetical protein